MLARRLAPVLMCALVLVLAGCEGDTGPMGPTGPQGPSGPEGPAGDYGESMILAYGQVDGTLAVPVVSGLGPVGVGCACQRYGTGHIDIILTGVFPAQEGLLLVTPTSGTGGNGLDNNIVYANVTTWSTTRVVACVESRDVAAGAAEDTDFAFVVMKY